MMPSAKDIFESTQKYQLKTLHAQSDDDELMLEDDDSI